MTDILNPLEQIMDYKVPTLQDAILEGAIDMIENLSSFSDQQRASFTAYFVFGNEIHDGQHELLKEEFGLAPCLEEPGKVVTFDGTKLYVLKRCFDAIEGQEPIPYDITYSSEPFEPFVSPTVEA